MKYEQIVANERILREAITDANSKVKYMRQLIKEHKYITRKSSNATKQERIVLRNITEKEASN